jgi:phage terminase large subunit
MFSKGAKYTSKSARTDIQFINRLTRDDRGRILGIRRGMERNRESLLDVL